MKGINYGIFLSVFFSLPAFGDIMRDPPCPLPEMLAMCGENSKDAQIAWVKTDMYPLLTQARAILVNQEKLQDNSTIDKISVEIGSSQYTWPDADYVEFATAIASDQTFFPYRDFQMFSDNGVDIDAETYVASMMRQVMHIKNTQCHDNNLSTVNELKNADLGTPVWMAAIPEYGADTAISYEDKKQLEMIDVENSVLFRAISEAMVLEISNQ